MRRQHVSLEAEWLGGRGDVLAYGHYGRPLLAFPSESGNAYDFESRGMLAAIAPLVDAGRVKVYAIDSFDEGSWRRHDLSLDERARNHAGYERWILERVLPFVDADCGGGHQNVIAVGSSLGAYHAANIALRHADRFGLAICMSGVYDLSDLPGDRRRSEDFYFANPFDYAPQPRWRAPGLAPVGGLLAARLRPGAVGGHDGRAGLSPSVRRAARRQADPPRARPLGP